MAKLAARKKYLEVSYNEEKLPRTSYPKKLATYLFEKFYKTNGALLDVGCGRGEFLESFQQIGMQTSGIDLSPSIKEMDEKYKMKQCDFESDAIPFADESFDFIFSKSVIEHLHCPMNLMDQCLRVLKPRGKAIFMCPSWVHTYWGPFYIDHTHVTPYTLPSLRQALELSGFKIISSEHFIQLPIVWRIPFFKLFCFLTAVLPIPFRPLHNSILPEFINKWVRFSNEKMLLVVAEKL